LGGIIVSNNIDLSFLNDEFKNYQYEVPYDPLRGFSLVNDNDKNLYTNITAHLYRDIPDSYKEKIISNFNHLKNISISIQKMPPGSILPYHKDRYGYFVKMNPNIDLQDIQRIIVFLEKWKPGHISEINGQPITNWQQGDYISWNGDCPHMAANLGSEDRYTLQITGIIS
jgi:hypothetical protein